MYSPLNEQFMFQQVHDRTEGMRPVHARAEGPHLDRRWWRKALHRAG